jgi:hypothetical protein
MPEKYLSHVCWSSFQAQASNLDWTSQDIFFATGKIFFIMLHHVHPAQSFSSARQTPFIGQETLGNTPGVCSDRAWLRLDRWQSVD